MGKIKEMDSSKKMKRKSLFALKKKKEAKAAVKLKNKIAEESGDDLDEDEEEEPITLDIIKQLGGDASDLELLTKDLDTDEPTELDQSGEDELKKMISSLNLAKYAKQGFIIKDKEVVEELKPTEKDLNKLKKKSEEENNTAETTDEEETDNEKEESDDAINTSAEVGTGALRDDKLEGKKSDFHFVKTPPARTYCVMKSGEKWYDTIKSVSDTLLNQNPEGESSSSLSYWLPKVDKYADKVWELEVSNHEKAQKGTGGGSKSEKMWMRTVLQSGTLTDKMAAYVVQIQESPVHTFKVLESLLGLVSLKSRRPCLLALETLTQLLISDLLVPDRKLRSFDKNPFHLLQELSGGNKDTRDRYLIAWKFEDRLRDFYIRFIQAIDIVGKDTIDNTRIKVISANQRLLCGNPEQEQLLLEKLINRLGDRTRAVAAKAMQFLTATLEEHPGMKDIVVKEVERLLYRPNISPKAQYYGICFLSQLMMEKNPSGCKLAGKLVNIYFSFFRITIKKGEIDTKLMSALLTGVNRAFPYSSLDPKQLDQQLETMHKLVHMVSFNISVQALTLLYQIMDSRDEVTDRFYSALYRKLLDPAFAQSSKQVMFLNLLFNSIRKDASLPRVRGFVKRMLQCCEHLPSHATVGVLFIVSEIIRDRGDLGSLKNVLYTHDLHVHQQASNTDLSRFEDDSEDEHYEDVKEEEEDEHQQSKDECDNEKVVPEESKPDIEEIKQEKVESSWVFKKKTGKAIKSEYDPLCRNPLYAGADKSPYWELDSLCHHFHPTVAMFAQNLSDNAPIIYPGDPLSDFTIAKFLDRFVFRNPKKDPAKNKPSTVLGKRNIYRPSGIKAVAPDSKDFVSRPEASIPGDELFLYKYFQSKAERETKDDEDDNASVNSEEFNDFLDNMGGKSKDFKDEDVDFAGGVKEGEDQLDDDLDDMEEDEEDDIEDDSAPEEESEPEGLDGETSDGFKDLSDDEEAGDDEDSSMLQMDEDDNDDDDDDEEMNEEDLDFGFEDDDEPSPTIESRGKKVKTTAISDKKSKKTKRLKFDPNNLDSLLADADEFSHIIEQNEDGGMAGSFSTKDKAGAKQLRWEQDRHDFMQSKPWKKGKGGGKGGGKSGGRANKSAVNRRKPGVARGKPPKKKIKR